jgi:cyclophilin family peptidyl-prolyl cis-trans isomerase
MLKPVGLFGLALGLASGPLARASDSTVVRLETTFGAIVLTLDRTHAPRSVENFLQYVRAGFYDGTIFHRVIDGFVVQGGGFSRDYERQRTTPPIANEADNGLYNKRGTVAMARTSDPDSATSQFFINLKDNAFLDHQARTPAGWGYAVFGRVTDGMAVVDKIAAAETGAAGPFPQDAPLQAIVLEKATVESP